MLPFPLKKFIAGVYSLQILFKELLNGFQKGYFWKHLSVVEFDNTNFQPIIIASYLIIEWLLNEKDENNSLLES